jgi:hypothetical protein
MFVPKSLRPLVAVAALLSALIPATTATAAPWSAVAPMATARTAATATTLADGSVLVAGGDAGGGTVLASAERYDPATDAWSPAGTMATAREQASATLLRDGIGARRRRLQQRRIARERRAL